MTNDPVMTLEKVKDYVEGLRIWTDSDAVAQIATDILYLIEEK